jgi:CRISPR-associated exonuclease Cas4
MVGVTVDRGILFYAQSHRRVEVELTPQLRTDTENACRRMHEIVCTRELPAPEPGPKCRQCSLVLLCQPHATAKNVKLYVSTIFDSE